MGSSHNIPLHRRLFLGLVLFASIMVICFTGFQYCRELDFKVEELNIKLQNVNSFVIHRLEKGDTIFTANELPQSDIRISIFDLKGYAIYDNTIEKLSSTNHLDRKEIREALSKGEGFTVRRNSSENGLQYFYSAKLGNNVIVRSAIPYSTSLQSLLAPDFTFIWITIIIAFAVCTLGYFATHRLGRNISRLAAFARRAEQGERIYDTQPFPHDELGDISNNIVRLYAQLQSALNDRDKEHKEVLHQEREKIRIKKQLTNNINHELKTPVAAMALCLETLTNHPDMDAEKRIEFINRCMQSNQRLQSLLTDVSMLTRMEDGAQKLTKSVISLYEIISNISEEFNQQAAVKGIDIDIKVSNDLKIEGNQNLLESVFRNLFSNAIAYSGGKNIFIFGKRIADNIEIIFTDDGDGIGEEHLQRIFERFYRIDKGRSRALGGTGLGLAIVKNALLWHNASITAENSIPHGLSFRITFPKQDNLKI